MMRTKKNFLTNSKRIFLIFILAALPLQFCFFGGIYANNLSVSNVSLLDQNAVEKTAKIKFDLSWEHSWRNNANHDAAWVFAKYSKDGGSTWLHATLKASGSNPAGFSKGTGTQLDIVVPSDKKGVFLRRAENGAGTASAAGVKLSWDWGADNLSTTDIVRVRVFAVEMVYIPQGPFYAGDFAASEASLKSGASDNDPWQINSEGAISAANTPANGYYYVSAANSGENSTASAFTIPAAYPKGYNAFYAMKYEISEGQWVGFFSTLSNSQKGKRDITSSTGKNSDSVVNRNSVSWTTGVATTSYPDRACSFLSWMDICAYADWAGLRPITELEFEKICRGAQTPADGEFAWGNLTIAAAAAISGTENGTETITNAGANACYDNKVFTGGGGGQGPLRCGIFATAASNRVSAGAGYYGVMELSGNVWERCVTIGNAEGRSFTGTHGDGRLTETADYEGNATNSDWPGIDAAVGNGVTGSAGSGLRGGAWDSAAAVLRVSDRLKAALSSGIRSADYGGRLARTAP